MNRSLYSQNFINLMGEVDSCLRNLIEYVKSLHVVGGTGFIIFVTPLMLMEVKRSRSRVPSFFTQSVLLCGSFVVKSDSLYLIFCLQRVNVSGHISSRTLCVWEMGGRFFVSVSAKGSWIWRRREIMESTQCALLVSYRGHVEMACVLVSIVVVLLFKQWLQCSKGNLMLSFLWSVRAEGREPAKALMSSRTAAVSSDEKTCSARELFLIGPPL